MNALPDEPGNRTDNPKKSAGSPFMNYRVMELLINL